MKFYGEKFCKYYFFVLSKIEPIRRLRSEEGMKKLYHLQSIKNYRKIIGIIQVLRITI
jgi:hypothetical protein